MALGVNRSRHQWSFLGLPGRMLAPIQWRLIFLVSSDRIFSGTIWAYRKCGDSARD